MKKLFILFFAVFLLVACEDNDKVNKIAYSMVYTDCEIKEVATTGGKYPEYSVNFVKDGKPITVPTDIYIYRYFKELDKTYPMLELNKKDVKFDITILDDEVVGITLAKNRR